MVRLTKLTIACAAVLLSVPATFGAIIEVGDLNIIDQVGSASNGLRFLEMTYSVGRTEADALANARATYPNARLATAAEWDDLFAAAGIGYDAGLKASDAFNAGATTQISSGGNYDGGDLVVTLGFTNGEWLYAWSAPDGSSLSSGTRDFVYLDAHIAQINNSTRVPADPDIGWLIVSEVPEPSSLVLWSALGLMGLAGARRRKRQAAPATTAA